MIRQICPGCGATLGLPGEAAGRRARCPACQQVFPVTATPPDDRRTTPRAVVRADMDAIAAATVAIFAERWGRLLLCTLVFGLLTVLAHLPAIPLLMPTPNRAAPGTLRGSGALAIQLLVTVLTLYLNVGFFHAVLAIARGASRPLRDLFVSWRIFGRVLGGAVVIATAATLLLVVSLLLTWLVAVLAGGGEPSDNTLVGVAVLVLLLGSVAAQLCLWPWLFAVCEPGQSAIGSLRLALRIVARNKVNTFLLLTLTLLLAAVGTAFCLVGNVVTLPITVLLLAVAYRKMTDQRVADPRSAAAAGGSGGRV